MSWRRFETIRREHAAMRHALDRLDSATHSTDPSSPRRRTALVAAVEEFLRGEARLLGHMALEEGEILVLLERHVPAEAGAAAVLREEHQTLRALMGLLRRDAARVAEGEVEVTAELAAAGQDLSKILRAHIHKEDEVVQPLLRRLLAEKRRD